MGRRASPAWPGSRDPIGRLDVSVTKDPLQAHQPTGPIPHPPGRGGPTLRLGRLEEQHEGPAGPLATIEIADLVVQG